MMNVSSPSSSRQPRASRQFGRGDLRNRWLIRSGILALLLLLFGLLLSGTHALSLTIDEPSHLAGGYTLLARGALWTVPQRGQPLLVDAWEALPFYIGYPDIPVEALPGWETDYLTFVRSFVDYVRPHLQQAVIAARVPGMLLAVLLSAVVCRWASELGGRAAGGIALLIAVFDPTLLAHGMLANNDVGVTAMGTIALYLLWRWSRTATWSRAILAGVLLGLTLLAKGSGVLWVVLGVAGATWNEWRTHRFARRSWPMLFLIGLLPCAILWAGDGFTVGRLPALPAVPIPAARYWTGVLFQAQHPDKPLIYALGVWRKTGWLWYYPVSFVLKNPLPLLVLDLVGLGFTLWQPELRRRFFLPALFALGYVTAAVAVGPGVGYRHILPIHPVLYLVTSAGILTLWRLKRLALRALLRALLVAVGVWYVIGTLRARPFYLSYFNEITGGSVEGWRYLEGSNTEWGQGWTALDAFEEKAGVLPAYSGWLGYSEAVPRNLWATSLPPTQGSAALLSPMLYPSPGDYVISANTLSGAQLVNHDNYAWFRHHQPDAVIADALFYYHVDAGDRPQWLAQCGIPVVPLSADAVSEGFGDIELRTLSFDCTQAWIYPGGGQANGVYALHEAALQPSTLRERLHLKAATPEDGFAASHLLETTQSYRQWEYQTWPAFALYEWDGAGELRVPTFAGGIATAETQPLAVEISRGDSRPIPLGQSFAFLGHGDPCYSEGVLEIETWWQVLATDVNRPTSVMAHLIKEDGTPLAVADGLGVSPLSLTKDDVVVQRHRFETPRAGERLWLRTGIYYSDTQTRLQILGAEPADAIFVPLPDISRSCN